MNTFLEALFKVDPLALPGARLEFALTPPQLALACALAVLVALALGGYLPPRRRLLALMALRAVLAVLVVVVLARPQVMLPVQDTARAPVTVLLDESLSMNLADVAGDGTRSEQAMRLFHPADGRLVRDIALRFPVRVQRFAAQLHAPDDHVPGTANALSDPLGALLQAVSAGRSSGLVLVSDGGRLAGGADNEALLRLRATGVPVHVVGVGGAGLAPDAWVRAVSVPAVVLPGDQVDLSAWIDAVGFDGETVKVSVRDDGVLLGQIDVRVSRGRAVARLPVTLDEPGLRTLAVEVDAGDADRVPGNDVLWQPLRVRGEPVRVLHFEGEPRFEVKFLRRAVAGDRAIRLSSLVRTGDNRFLRLGVSDAQDLADGFPTSAKSLFAYDLVVLGSVESAALGAGGLALLKDFVQRRGASLLFLGGRNALAEGGFATTGVADLLPVHLETPDPDYRGAAAVVLTRDGERHPVTRELMSPGGVVRTVPLPALAVVNPVRRAKPGASVLLRGEDGHAEPIAMLAWHRFGAGRVAVLPARDTWRWRMHADVAPDDHTHRLFWRRLLRWLAREVPARVQVDVTPQVAAPGQTIEVRAIPRDAEWQPRKDARPRLAITTPLGDIHSQPMAWTPGTPGGFSARFVARDAGAHEVRVMVPGESLIGLPADVAQEIGGEAGLMVSAVGEEFRRTAFDDTLLRRIADETGGSYRHADEVSDLAARLAASAPASRELRRVSLWDAPVLLLALLALAALEWWLRRRRKELP